MEIVNVIILVLSLLSLPIFGIYIIFGLAGSTAEYFIIIAVGYVIAIVASVLGFFWTSVRYATLIGVFLILLGVILDHRFWKQHNRELCLELRANPTCIEDDTGFSCSDLRGMNFSTSKRICKGVSTQI
jgi:hypothetical protein